MWFLPLLVLGAIALAASRSSRDAVPPSRQLAPAAPSPLPASVSGVPGPIAVLGEILDAGKTPPPQVILCALAEAEARGHVELASTIVQTFVVPTVRAHEEAQRASAPVASAGSAGSAAPAVVAPVAAPSFPRAACAPAGSPRAQANYQRGSCAPVGSPRAQADQRSCAPRSAPSRPRAACAPVAPPVAPPGSPIAPAAPQLAPRYATQDEILAMLHTDPTTFLKVMATGRVPVIDAPVAPSSSPVPVAAPVAAAPSPPPAPAAPVAPMTVPARGPVAEPPAPEEIEAAITDQVSAQLAQAPGFSAAGVVLDPDTGAEVFEVRWLRGYPIPPLPEQVLGRPLRVAIDDALPVAQAQPPGLPPEAVAQMQEAAGLHEAADRTRSLAPGSPLPGVPDDAWRAFVVLLERESPQFTSSRHVGQYRQHRDRLAELGIDPRAIHGSAAAQRHALDADLADAYRHAVASGVLVEHVNRAIAVPGHEGAAMITLSGLLGVIQAAGLDGAVGWLERPNDRKRYPHTTQAFARTNGVF